MGENRYDDLFKEADDAFSEKYKDQLQKLKGLSKDEVALITPNIEDYTALIKVVEAASKNNLAQAELVQNIKQLGAVAIKIAKKIPQFAALL